MFEQLNFNQYHIPYPISKEFIEDILSETKTDHAEDFSYLDKMFIRSLLTQEQYIDYYYSAGSVLSTLQLPPVAPSVRHKFFTLNSFVLFSHIAPSYTKFEYKEGYTLLLVCKGSGYLKYKRKTYFLEKGSGFFIDNRFPSEYGCKDKCWEYALLDISGPLMNEAYANYEAEGIPVFSQPLHSRFFQNVEALLKLYQTVSLYRDWKADSLITNLLVELMTTPHKEKQQSQDNYSNIQYLILYMESNYRQNLSLEQLCSFSGFSRSALATEFKKYTGTSPNNYLIMLRLQKAKELLQMSTMTCADIAFETGFRDINNFTNLFKKYVGVTPNAWRQGI